MTKYERELKKLAKKYGRRVVTGGKHFKLECIHGRKPPVTVSASASDHRAVKNIEADLRRNNKGRDE